MVIYTDENGIIYDVGENTTGNENLIRVEINDEDNPFAGWSKGKICCYKCQVIDGIVVMMTPVVDSRIIRNFDMAAVKPYTETKTAYYGDTEATFYDIPDGNITVYVKDSEGNYPNYSTSKKGNTITVTFDPVIHDTEITISIIGG